ncbi:MarR family winged helix-turn-helix transcriptional regulator [Chitinophagaceae bacterium LWZ2-11]
MASKKDLSLAADIRVTVSGMLRQFRKRTIGYNISMTEHTTLAFIDLHGAILASELAALERVTAQSMSQIINHLQELGYVTKKISEQDKRKVFISLSQEGKAMLTEVRNARTEWLATAINDKLTSDEKKVLEQAVLILKKLEE